MCVHMIHIFSDGRGHFECHLGRNLYLDIRVVTLNTLFGWEPGGVSVCIQKIIRIEYISRV